MDISQSYFLSGKVRLVMVGRGLLSRGEFGSGELGFGVDMKQKWGLAS